MKAIDLLAIVGVWATLTVIVFCTTYTIWIVITEINNDCFAGALMMEDGTYGPKGSYRPKECDKVPYRTLALTPLIGVPLTYAFFRLKEKI